MSIYDKNGNELKAAYSVNGAESDCYNIDGILIHRISHEIEYDDISGSYGILGRWYAKEIEGVQYPFTNNAGSELYVKVTGATYVSIVIEKLNGYDDSFDTKYIAYSIDNGEFVRQVRTNPIIPMPDDGVHTVRVLVDSFKETASNVSKWGGTYGMYLKSITSDGTMTGIYPKNRIGIFYGDSITEGVNTLGTGALGQVNSACYAFPMFCGLAMGAIPYRVGYGASGFTVAGSFNTFINAIDYVEDGVAAPSVSPDFIVVFHGTNDHNGVPQETAEAALDRLIEKYGNIHIFVISPNTSLSNKTLIPVCNTNPLYHHISKQNLNLDTTDGVHLSVEGARTLGEYMAQQIVNTIGY